MLQVHVATQGAFHDCCKYTLPHKHSHVNVSVSSHRSPLRLPGSPATGRDARGGTGARCPPSPCGRGGPRRPRAPSGACRRAPRRSSPGPARRGRSRAWAAASWTAAGGRRSLGLGRRAKHSRGHHAQHLPRIRNRAGRVVLYVTRLRRGQLGERLQRDAATSLASGEKFQPIKLKCRFF